MSQGEAEILESTWTAVEGLSVHALASRAVPERARTVVCVHGLGVSGAYFIAAAVRLARRFRVFVPDLPGFGLSARPARVLDVSELADALRAWMEAAGLERASLLANSLGCQVAVDLAVRHPGRVERAILVGPTVDPHARTFARQLLRLLLDTVREPPDLVRLIARDYLAAGPRRTLVTARAALADRIEEKLPLVGVPALVVRGQRDAIVSARWADEVARLLPHGELAVVECAAHAVHYSAPDALVRLVESFIDRR